MTDSFVREMDILREMGQNTFVLRGSTLLVEILPPEEIKTKSGLIVAHTEDHVKGGSAKAHSVDIGRVLMSGQGYWNDGSVEVYDEAIGFHKIHAGYEPLEAQPGAIVILPQFSTQLMSHFPGIQRPTGNRLALVKMDQVLAYYPTQEVYELAKQKLNE